MYMLGAGQVDIIYEDKLLDTVSEGGYFGEMSLIDSSSRSARAVMCVSAEVIPVDRQRFLYLV
ncbi:MAG: cyclic nucleotide-binding domain-containing protein [Chloroflexota bacterium]